MIINNKLDDEENKKNGLASQVKATSCIYIRYKMVITLYFVAYLLVLLNSKSIETGSILGFDCVSFSSNFCQFRERAEFPWLSLSLLSSLLCRVCQCTYLLCWPRGLEQSKQALKRVKLLLLISHELTKQLWCCCSRSLSLWCGGGDGVAKIICKSASEISGWWWSSSSSSSDAICSTSFAFAAASDDDDEYTQNHWGRKKEVYCLRKQDDDENGRCVVSSTTLFWLWFCSSGGESNTITILDWLTLRCSVCKYT